MPWSPSKPRQLGRLSHFVKCFRCQNPPGPLMSLTLRKSHFAYGGCVGLFLFILVHRKLSFNYTKLQFLLFLLHPAVTPLLLSVLPGFVCVSFQAISHAFYLQVCSSWKCIINFRGNYLIFHKWFSTVTDSKPIGTLPMSVNAELVCLTRSCIISIL